ncbi:hypothetical protein ACF0H5_004289 [Mactra antiquata]
MEYKAASVVDNNEISELFEGQEKLAMKYSLDVKYASDCGNSFEKTLMKLKYEMVQLLRCDVQLYKQLTELSQSVQQLKEDVKRQNNLRPRFNSLTTTSSTDGSFITAADDLEVKCDVLNGRESISDTSDERVISWINSCSRDVDNNVTENSIPDSLKPEFHRLCSNVKNEQCYNHRCKELRSNLLRCQYQSNLHNTCDMLMHVLCNCTDKMIPNRSNQQLTDVESKYNRKKMIQSSEIHQDKIFSSYKSSLRLLGSIRMQSRIFEPIHSKYKPFALFNTLENFVSGTKPFLNIQPRPKLRRQNNILEPFELDISKHNTLLLADVTSKCNRLGSKNKDIFSADEPTTVSDFAQDNGHMTSDEITCEDTDEAKETGESLIRTDSGFSEESEAHTDSEFGENEPETEMEAFIPEFLHLNDGLITCRIMSPGLEKELESRELEHDDFEFLVFIDGKVTFVPHDLDSDNEESYYLAWIFEEDRKATDNEENDNELDKVEHDYWKIYENEKTFIPSEYWDGEGHSFTTELVGVYKDYANDRPVQNVLEKHPQGWSMDSGLDEDFSE